MGSKMFIDYMNKLEEKVEDKERKVKKMIDHAIYRRENKSANKERVHNLSLSNAMSAIKKKKI